ncbi:hypothetical protein LNP17_16895 [Klebsiella variicola subsp. variicola]|nr:hypothetical protein [Klebsiella variicola subsp. variicola]
MANRVRCAANERNLMWNVDPYLQTQVAVNGQTLARCRGSLQLSMVRLE